MFYVYISDRSGTRKVTPHKAPDVPLQYRDLYTAQSVAHALRSTDSRKNVQYFAVRDADADRWEAERNATT